MVIVVVVGRGGGGGGAGGVVAVGGLVGGWGGYQSEGTKSLASSHHISSLKLSSPSSMPTLGSASASGGGSACA